jgi:hypothetical protein
LVSVLAWRQLASEGYWLHIWQFSPAAGGKNGSNEYYRIIIMAMTLRLTPEQEAELERVQQVTGRATKSQALVEVMMRYISVQEKVKRQSEELAEQQREIARLSRAISKFKDAHAGLLSIEL